MAKLSKEQSGFSIVETVLLLVIVAAIAGVGWYVYHAQQKTSDTFNAATENSNNVSPQFKSKKTPAPTTTSGTSKSALQSELNTANTANSQSGQEASASSSALNDKSTFTSSQLPQ
jgi:uncharacterized protein HemX